MKLGYSLKKIFCLMMAFIVLMATMFVNFIPTFAETEDTVRPSVGQKPAPEIVPVIDETTGEPKQSYDERTKQTLVVIAVVVDKEIIIDGEIVKDVYVPELDIYPYEQVEDEETPENVRENLKEAYTEVHGATSLESLTEKLNDAAKVYDKSYNASVFVASDLFDMEVDDYYHQRIKNKEVEFLRVVFDLGLKEGDLKPTIIHKSEETGEWLVVDDKDTKILTDNHYYLQVDFKELCPIMILKVNPDRLIKEGSSLWIAILLPAIMFIFLMFFIIVRRDEEEEFVPPCQCPHWYNRK